MVLTTRWGERRRINDPCQAREKIIAAAYACYEEKGIAHTTFNDIAEAGNISRRTIYHYFDNKKALIQAVIDDQAGHFLAAMKQELGDKQLDLAQLVFEMLLYIINKGPDAMGHQALLGNQHLDGGAFYLQSDLQRAMLNELLEESFIKARRSGAVNQQLELDVLTQWLGRISLSFIQYPLPDNELKALLKSCLLPVLLPT